MRADERRKELAARLLSASGPIPGGELAEALGVSRQIIVRDIAALKAVGYEILATHRGYMIQRSPLFERVIKVRHTSEQTRDELTLIVDLGGTVADVFVWHRVYGRIEAKLNITTRAHVDRFLDGVRSGKSTELMGITGGYHYHTVRADSVEVLDVIVSALGERGYLAPGD